MKLNMSLPQVLLSIIVGHTVITGGTLPSAIVAASLVAYEVFRYINENKQKEADIRSFDEAFKKYKENFENKLGSLDSRISTFVAMRKM